MPAWLIHSLLRFLAWMPLPLNHALGAAVGAILLLWSNRPREVTRRNLQLCFPELDSADRRRLFRKAMIEAGKTATEFGPMWKAGPKRILRMVRSVEGAQALDQALAQGRGALLIAPHLGAWEILGLYSAWRWPLSTLYRRPRMKVFEDIIVKARTRTGSELLPADVGGIRVLYRHLKQGRLLGILPDQQPKQGAGVFAPFFGQPALTMVLVNRLALKDHPPAFYGVAERLSWGRGYVLRFVPAAPGIGDPDPQKAAAVLNADIEALVRRTPTQYQWTYKRFAIQPDGSKVY